MTIDQANNPKRLASLRRAARQGLFYLAHAVIYIDTADWWIGYYRGSNHHYVCLVPTVVIRWRRGR